MVRHNTWRKRSDNITVEVMHAPPESGITGENHWFIYVYIWESSPLFHKVNVARSDPLVASWGFHAGCSYTQLRQYGNVACKVFGCDYSHNGDDYYGSLGERDHAVFTTEADRLFNLLCQPTA
jgi:hypothetical protein